MRDKHYNEESYEADDIGNPWGFGWEGWSKGLRLYNLSILFFFTLLRYNSHTIKFAILQCTIQCFEYNSHSCISPLPNSRTISPQKETPYPSSSHSPFPSPQSSWQPPLLSASMDLPVVDVSYKWNHILRDLLCPPSFTEHNDLQVHPCCSIYVLHSFLSE